MPQGHVTKILPDATLTGSPQDFALDRGVPQRRSVAYNSIDY